MAWSTPRTWTVGEVVTAANMNTYISDDLTVLYGSTWTTFSPTLTQSGSVALTTATGRYQHVGYRCHLFIFLDPSGTGTGANDIVIGNIPAAIAPRATGAPASGNADTPSGIGTFHDTGAAMYSVHWFFVTSSTIKGNATTSSAGSYLGTSPNFAIAAGDSLTVNITYETSAASA